MAISGSNSDKIITVGRCGPAIPVVVPLNNSTVGPEGKRMVLSRANVNEIVSVGWFYLTTPVGTPSLRPVKIPLEIIWRTAKTASIIPVIESY